MFRRASSLRQRRDLDCTVLTELARGSDSDSLDHTVGHGLWASNVSMSRERLLPTKEEDAKSTGAARLMRHSGPRYARRQTVGGSWRPAKKYVMRRCPFGLSKNSVGGQAMQKSSWITTPLLEERPRPNVEPIRDPSRWRPLALAWTLGGAALRLFGLRLHGRADSRAVGRLVRHTLEQLGGLWIKVGQLLGMRRDLFSADFCDALAILQDHATGFEFEHVRRIVEADLGRPIEDMYEVFEEEPFAAASIGQIHRARLRSNGVLVAVKIRRPTIDEIVHKDVRFVGSICRFAQRLHLVPAMRWADFYHELSRTLAEELDYRFEATAIRDMRRNLREHGVYAPKVFHDFSSKRVLVMEFVSGVLMSELLRVRERDPQLLDEWMTDNCVEPSKVGRRLFQSLQRQLFEDNYFHGDLHPGNIVLMRNSRIGLIDFGSVGSLETDFLELYREMQRSVVQQKYAKAAEIFLLLGPELPPGDLELCKNELVDFMRSWALRARTRGIEFTEKSIGSAQSQMAAILARHKVPANWSFLRVIRAQLTLDSSLRALWPKMDYFKATLNYERSAARRRQRELLETLGYQLETLIDELPRLVHGATEQTFYELEWLRRRARHFSQTLSKAAMAGVMAFSVVGIATFIAALGVLLICLDQTGVSLPTSDRLNEYLDYAPRLPLELWYTLEAFLLVTLVQCWRVYRRFGEPDTQGGYRII